MAKRGSGGSGREGKSKNIAKINTESLIGTEKQNKWAADILNKPLENADWYINDWKRIAKTGRGDGVKEEAQAIIKGLNDFKQKWVNTVNDGIKSGRYTSKKIIEARNKIPSPYNYINKIRNDYHLKKSK